MNYDIIIKNGKIVDGAGNPWYRGEIGIKDGKIVKIRAKLEEDALKIIDADGLIVSPGFIDAHSHTDYILPLFNKVESFIRQGITTCVTGMCGDSLAPIPPEKMEDMIKQLTTISTLYEKLNITWHTFEDYLKELEKNRCAINLVCFVGYNNIRIAGGAGFEDRPPTSEELEGMKMYLSEALEAGAFGMSTGLTYTPQGYADTEELIELVKVIAKYNGLYFSHIRGEAKTLIKAVKELIEIVEKSGCIGGQIAHLKVSGKIYWGASKEMLSLIEQANARGLNITCDQYPYHRGMCHLKTALPLWAREGNVDEIIERIKSPKIRDRIKNEILNDIGTWENLIYDNGFKSMFIASVSTDKWRDIIGKNISEITKIKNTTDDWETFFELLIDEPAVFMTMEDQSEEDIRRIMTSRYQMIGTDGAGIPNIPALGAFHPRFYGTYPRILGKYVREEKVLTLEDAIRKMTSFPAQRLGLIDRGMIKENMWADIVIFNPNTVIDKATFKDTHQFSEGIIHVIVNGVIVVENNKQNRKRPGKVLRNPN